MQTWELIRRLLSAARPGRSFSAGAVGRKYRQDLAAGGEEELAPADEFERWAEELSELLETEGLLGRAPGGRPGIALLDEKVPTEFGSELLDTLGIHVETFELMYVDVDKGSILRTLHQLNS
ncbi:hypothetical protein ACPA5B_11710 [Pseudomonas solani]|uniref:hypothetical protein n=1 Tax=Pseudomonas solani TaxID=2731552 RepID=UPI003C306349